MTAARALGWDAESGIATLRGGDGFTEDDVHFVRAAHCVSLTLRLPAPRPANDPIGAAGRAAVRSAAGYPLSLAMRPGTLEGEGEALEAWLSAVAAALERLGAYRKPMEALVDQILLREGPGVAFLGGNTLILEAEPGRIPTVEAIETNIAALLATASSDFS